MMVKGSRTRHRWLCAAAAVGLGCGASMALSGCRQGPSRTQLAHARANEHVAQAENLLTEGRLEEAIAYFEQAIAVNPTLVTAHIGLADAQRERGDYQSAATGYQRAAEIEPGNFDAQYRHGLMLQLLDRLTEAVRAYLRALAIRPTDFDANMNLATTYLQLDEPRQSLPYARRAVQIDRKSGPARVNLGAVYAAMGRHNEAVLEFQAAAELMDLTPPLLLNLADSLGKAGRYQEMVNTLERLQRMEASAAAHERMGFAQFKLGDYTGAMRSFRKALEIDPDYYPALNGVGVCELNRYLLSDRQDVQARTEAIRALRRSVQINRDQPRIVELISRYG